MTWPAETYDPERDIDWIAVERTVAGTYDPKLLNTAELIEAAMRLVDSGLSAKAAGAHLRVAQRTVTHWLARGRTEQHTTAA